MPSPKPLLVPRSRPTPLGSAMDLTAYMSSACGAHVDELRSYTQHARGEAPRWVCHPQLRVQAPPEFLPGRAGLAPAFLDFGQARLSLIIVGPFPVPRPACPRAEDQSRAPQALASRDSVILLNLSVLTRNALTACAYSEYSVPNRRRITEESGPYLAHCASVHLPIPARVSAVICRAVAMKLNRPTNQRSIHIAR